MHNFSTNRQSGMTLIELIMAITIFTLLSGAVMAAIVSIFQTQKYKSALLTDVDQARMTLSRFGNEIRNASYGNDGSYPIYEASSTEVIFFTSFGTTTSKMRRIRYYLSGGKLYKGVVIPSGSPLAYNLGSEVQTVAHENVMNTSTPVFLYYDGDYNGLNSPLSQPVNLNDVKFVKMNLMLTDRSQSTASTTFSISSGASIRNLKNNLGN